MSNRTERLNGIASGLNIDATEMGGFVGAQLRDLALQVDGLARQAEKGDRIFDVLPFFIELLRTEGDSHIEAIKLYRNATFCGLKEAKDVCNEIRRLARLLPESDARIEHRDLNS